jgi:hypothetical protein
MKQRVAAWKIGVVLCSAALVTGFVVYRAAGREKPPEKRLMPGTKRMEILTSEEAAPPPNPPAEAPTQTELMPSSKLGPIVTPADQPKKQGG